VTLISCAQSLESRSRSLYQSRDVVRGRRTNQVSHTPPLLDSSLPHHDHFFRQSSCLGQIVRHEERSDSEIVAQIVEALLKFRSRDRVERSERLIEQNHAGPGGDAPRQCDALSLATGELVGKTRPELSRWKSNELERAPSGVG
jgi:hypothetical protein